MDINKNHQQMGDGAPILKLILLPILVNQLFVFKIIFA